MKNKVKHKKKHFTNMQEVLIISQQTYENKTTGLK